MITLKISTFILILLFVFILGMVFSPISLLINNRKDNKRNEIDS